MDFSLKKKEKEKKLMQMLAGLYLFASQMYFLCGTAGLVQYSTVQSELVITKRMVV